MVVNNVVQYSVDEFDGFILLRNIENYVYSVLRYSPSVPWPLWVCFVDNDSDNFAVSTILERTANSLDLRIVGDNNKHTYPKTQTSSLHS